MLTDHFPTRRLRLMCPQLGPVACSLKSCEHISFSEGWGIEFKREFLISRQMYSSSYTCTPLQQKSISFTITFLYYKANSKLWIRHSEPTHNHAAPGSDWIVATSPWGGHFLLKVFPPRHCLISQETIWTLRLGFLSNIVRCVPSSLKCFKVTVVVNWCCIKFY